MDGMVALMTVPPDVAGSAELWMTIDDGFDIPGRGTVVTGQLQGNVPLNVGDTMVCDGGRWKVRGISQSRVVLTTAEPGSAIGILLRKGPGGDVLIGRTATFEPGTSADGPKKRFWRR
jgi:translation elongation factor EF-Tu-like GTPase